MKKPNPTGICIVSLAIGLLAAPVAQAQLSGMMQNVMGNNANSGGSGMMSGLGGMSTPSLGATAPTNLAGVLQYCIQNNDLSSSSAASVKDRLLGKLTGSGGGAANSGYSAGNSGMLETGPGQSYRLGGAGVQQQVTRKVCNLVLQHAQSML